jgi:hypothetical protein
MLATAIGWCAFLHTIHVDPRTSEPREEKKNFSSTLKAIQLQFAVKVPTGSERFTEGFSFCHPKNTNTPPKSSGLNLSDIGEASRSGGHRREEEKKRF